MKIGEITLRKLGAWICELGALAYLVALPLLLFVLLPWFGERNVATAFFLYLPRSLWLLPAFVVLPYLLFVGSRRRFVIGVLLVLVCVGPGMGFRIGGWLPKAHPGEAGSARLLRIVSYNRGQHKNQSLQPFLASARPDVVLMQEAQKRAINYRRDEAYRVYPHIEDLGEFLILSRYPIVERALVVTEQALPEELRKRKPKRKRNRKAGSEAAPEGEDEKPFEARPVAARFVIEMPDGRRVSIYNVHTLTPRDTLRYYARGGFVLGVIGLPLTPFAAARRKHDAYWQARLIQLEELRDRVRADRHPAVIAGDFNVPTGGFAYRKLRSDWGEAHHDAGVGYGLSFPGETRNPLSLGGPWMRIDHIFYDRRWRAIESQTEKGRKSQHRAISAVLELREG